MSLVYEVSGAWPVDDGVGCQRPGFGGVVFDSETAAENFADEQRTVGFVDVSVRSFPASWLRDSEAQS